MLDNGRISSVQLFLILFALEGSAALLYAVQGVTLLAGPDGWFSVFLSNMLYGLAILLLTVALGKRFPDQTFAEYLPEIMGKMLGKLMSAAYAIVFIFFTAVVLSEGSWFIGISFYTNTPHIVFVAVLTAVAIYGAYLGIEVIARNNGMVIVTWYIASNVLLLLLTQEIDLGNLKPVFENGLLPVLRGGIYHSIWSADMFLMLILYPYLNQKNEAIKTSLLLTGTLATSAAIVHVNLVGIFGSLVTAHMFFPFEAAMGYISVGRFLERLESVFMVLWIGAIIMKLAIFYHSTGIITANTLGLKSYRITLIPIAAASIALSGVCFGTFFKLTDFLLKFMPIIEAVFALIIPATILLIAVIRKKKASYSTDHTSSVPNTNGGCDCFFSRGPTGYRLKS